MEELPERALYDIYAHTIATRFPAFALREFDAARFDMAQTLHTHDDSGGIDQALLDIIVTPESHERFSEDLDAFIRKHGLRGWIDAGESAVFLTDHGQFTDVPVLAETLGRVNIGHRSTTVQVVSEMISQIGLDLGQGEIPVIDTLRRISSVVQTVPRLDGSPTESVRQYRERKNTYGLRILEAVRTTEGSKTVMSLIARHNVTSKNGNTLYIHEPNRRTLEAYVETNTKIVPVYIDCPTFGESGSVEPAEIRYEFFRPMFVSEARDDTRKIVELFREATNRTVGDRYRNGVKVRSWRAQMAKQRVKAALPATGGREATEPRPDY
ncbi:MAG: hypothetical protein HKN24_09160 [Acidimicrobiales bacterium]|nr:hypothetical protein [Acidimicrobiales bacterium]